MANLGWEPPDRMHISVSENEGPRSLSEPSRENVGLYTLEPCLSLNSLNLGGGDWEGACFTGCPGDLHVYQSLRIIDVGHLGACLKYRFPGPFPYGRETRPERPG